MKTTEFIALFLMAAFVSCSDSAEEQAEGNVLYFSASHEWPDQSTSSRSSWNNMGFTKGDDIEVFACYSEQADISSSSGEQTNTTLFSPNFMNRQMVSYDGFAWSYSPLKYWPRNGSIKFHSWAPINIGESDDPELLDEEDSEVDEEESKEPYLKVIDYDGSTGLPIFSYECQTGLDPFYEANVSVDIADGVLSGDVVQGSNGGVQLTFHPAPNRYDIMVTVDEILYDPDHHVDGVYQECRFLILNFKIWGIYKKAQYSMSENKWYNHDGMYTKEDPLDMTPYLNFVDTEESIHNGTDYYEYNPDNGYDTKWAVVVGETSDKDQHTKLFNKPGFFIPADVADIPGNEAGFEIQYVILTDVQDHPEKNFDETGIITRSGSLKEAFDAKHNGRVDFVTDINLHFTIEEVTVTCNLYDYKYKAMF